jgi:hypothetical protein
MNLGGFFSCKAGEMITGFGYSGSSYGKYDKFKFQGISEKKVQKALGIIHLSNQIIDIQKKYTG